jgi:Holliday junction resolvase-like predicted endonuclease
MPRDKTPTIVTVKKRAPSKAATTAIQSVTNFSSFVGPEKRAALIAEAAYFLAEKRGFSQGHETEDWLAAENEVDARLLRAESPPRV